MVKDEIEPHLADAKPFYGGSEGITIVEVMTASFVFRLYAHMKAGMMPEGLEAALAESCPVFERWGRTILGSKVLKAEVWDEEGHVAKTRPFLEKMKSS
jgi:glutathione S-transferase